MSRVTQTCATFAAFVWILAACGDGTGPEAVPERIAFVTDRDGNGEIYVMNADGSAATRVTNDPAADFHPAWSPDGTRIAFASRRDGNSEVYVMSADGGALTRLTDKLGRRFRSRLVAGRNENRLLVGPRRQLRDLRDGSGRRRRNPTHE